MHGIIITRKIIIVEMLVYFIFISHWRIYTGHQCANTFRKIVQLISLYVYIFLLLDPVDTYLLHVYRILTSTNSTGTSDVYKKRDTYKTFQPRPFI